MAETFPLKSALSRAVLGAASFLALHVVFALGWERWFMPAALETPWFLGSKSSIVITQVALGIVALFVTARGRSGWGPRFLKALALVSGVMVAMTCLFFLLGPSRLMLGPTRLWPWVLLSGLLLLGPAILAGTLLGGILWRRA